MATPDTVRQYYSGILFRDPSEAEVAGWSAVIDNSVVSLEQARAAFIASPEAADIVAPIVRLYQSAFGRVPDRAGLDFWADAARADPAVLDTLALQFSQSAEGRSLYGPGNDVNVPFLTALYLNVLGRAPDTEGFNFWLGSSLGRDQVLLQFSESVENKERSATGVSRFLDNSAQGTETFSGDLYDAAHGGDAPETPVGETFGLTSSVDRVTGTALNDTVNAVISATAGATTLTGLDQIDGGAGEDTLNISDDRTTGGPTALPAGSKVQNVEALNLTSNQDVGSQSKAFDTSSFAGLKTETVSADAAFLKVAGGTDLTVTTNFGDAEITGGNTVVVASAGDATVAGARSVTVDAGADALVTGGTTVAVTSKGDATVDGAQDVTVDAGGAANVSKATGAVSVKAVGAATVGASETSDVIISSGADATVAGARTVSVVADGNVDISGATGAVVVNEQATAATIKVAGGTTVNVIGIGSDLDVKGLPTGSASSNTVTIGAAPAVGPGSPSGYPEVITNLSSNPTGDVAVDFSTAYTDADGKAGVVFGTGAAAIYTNGAATVSATGVGATVITDVQTTALKATSSGTAAPGTSTLATVNLNGLSGAATITSDALTELSVLDSAVGNTVKVANSTKDHALGLTVGNTVATIQDDTAASIAIATQASAYEVVGGAAVGAGSLSTIALNAAKATSVTSSGAADLSLDLTANAAQTSFDGSAASGDVVLTGVGNKVAAISTGSGDDTFTVSTLTEKDDDTTTKNINEVVSAVASSGDGKDTITINTDGDNTTTVDAGGGNDSVAVTKRSTGVLTVSLGGGDDSFTSAGAVTKNDVVDGGAGLDTLLLSGVGSANVGAFRNFDVFDAVGLSTTLDTSLLAAKNTVAEFVASGAVNANAELTNVGAGVGFRATGDMAGSALTLTQATAGAITVTLDADEVDEVAAAGNDVNASVTLTKATSVKAVFDTAFADKLSGTVTNAADMVVGATAATTLEVVSGGAEAVNSLAFTAGAALTSATVSGAQALDLSVTGATSLASVDASAHTGGLTFSLADLVNGGTVTLGLGRDVVTATSASTGGGVESIAGFERAAAAATSPGATAPEAAARDAARADADQLVLGGAAVADTPAPAVTGGTVANGVLDFTGAGPATLNDALGIANLAAEGNGEAVLFEYGGSSYVFVQGATDTVVRLADVTGVTSLIESTTALDHFVIA